MGVVARSVKSIRLRKLGKNDGGPPDYACACLHRVAKRNALVCKLLLDMSL